MCGNNVRDEPVGGTIALLSAENENESNIALIIRHHDIGTKVEIRNSNERDIVKGDLQPIYSIQIQ